jgi:hypothetical protein
MAYSRILLFFDCIVGWLCFQNARIFAMLYLNILCAWPLWNAEKYANMLVDLHLREFGLLRIPPLLGRVCWTKRYWTYGWAAK